MPAAYAGETQDNHFKVAETLFVMSGDIPQRFGLGGWTAAGEGRLITQGPMVKGPYLYAFGLCVVMDNHGGTGKEHDDGVKAGTEIEIVDGDIVVHEGVAYKARVEVRGYDRYLHFTVIKAEAGFTNFLSVEIYTSARNMGKIGQTEFYVVCEDGNHKLADVIRRGGQIARIQKHHAGEQYGVLAVPMEYDGTEREVSTACRMFNGQYLSTSDSRLGDQIRLVQGKASYEATYPVPFHNYFESSR